MSVVTSPVAKGAISTDIIISDLSDDIVAALDEIAERCAMSREDFIGAVLAREARKPPLTAEQRREWREGCQRLSRLSESSRGSAS